MEDWSHISVPSAAKDSRARTTWSATCWPTWASSPSSAPTSAATRASAAKKRSPCTWPPTNPTACRPTSVSTATAASPRPSRGPPTCRSTSTASDPSWRSSSKSASQRLTHTRTHQHAQHLTNIRHTPTSQLVETVQTQTRSHTPSHRSC